MIAILAVDVGGSFVKSEVRILDKIESRSYFYKFRCNSFLQLNSKIEEIYNKHIKEATFKILSCAFAGRVLKEKNIVSVSKWNERKNGDDIFLRQHFNKRFFFNDVECAINAIDEIKLKTIKSGQDNGKIKLLVYIGSGMGVAFLINKDIYPSEFGSSYLPIDLSDTFERKIIGDKILKSEEILSSKGIEFLNNKLGYKERDFLEIVKLIKRGKLIAIPTIFSKLLGRSLRTLALTTLCETIILGGKPLQILKPTHYKLMLSEFLKGENNLFYLKDVSIKKIEEDVDLPLKGAIKIALHFLKEKKIG